MSKFIRTAILTFLIALPTFVFACLRVGLFGRVVPAWVIWLVRRQVAREKAPRNPSSTTKGPAVTAEDNGQSR